MQTLPPFLPSICSLPLFLLTSFHPFIYLSIHPFCSPPSLPPSLALISPHFPPSLSPTCLYQPHTPPPSPLLPSPPSNSLQYFKPYVSADLQKMAEAFNTSVEQLEVELKKLILDGQMAARIDSHAQVHSPCCFGPGTRVAVDEAFLTHTRRDFVHVCV